MPNFLKIDSIMFFVSDLEKSAKFYESVLGLKVGWTDMEEGMIGLFFPENDLEIVIHNDPGLPNHSFSFRVSDVEKFCGAYEKRGYCVVKGSFQVRCGN